MILVCVVEGVVGMLLVGMVLVDKTLDGFFLCC